MKKKKFKNKIIFLIYISIKYNINNNIKAAVDT